MTNHWMPTNTSDTGAFYDPATDTWTATSTTNAPSLRYVHAAGALAQRMVAWGGCQSGRYNPDYPPTAVEFAAFEGAPTGAPLWPQLIAWMSPLAAGLLVAWLALRKRAGSGA